MRLPIFLSGLAIPALGCVAMWTLEKPASYGFLTGSLTIGGGLMICGLFSLRNRLHGIIGAGVIALLGVSRGVINLAAMPQLLLGGSAGGQAPVLESAVALICCLLLGLVIRCLLAEKNAAAHGGGG
jgi:hypothetical protein